MNICLLGNSHIACVKNAWDSMSSTYNLDTITFFGSHADTLLNTISYKNKLLPTNNQVQNSFNMTSNGKTEIDFSLYDICVVHGILPPLRGWYNLSEDFKKNTFYSQAFYSACIKHYNPIVKHLIKEITSSTTIPVIFTPKPHTALQENKLVISNDDFQYLCNFMASGFKAIGLHYIPQPRETLIDFFYTKIEYNKDGLGLGRIPTKEMKLTPANNYRHMNTAYGEAYLKQLFRYLKTFNNETQNYNIPDCVTN